MRRIGSAGDAAELIAAKQRFDRVGRGKEISRVQRLVPEELEGAAPKRIAPGLGRQVDDPAVEAAELGGRAVAFDLELLNRVDVRKERDLPGLGLQHRDAVEQILVGAGPAAVDARQRGRGRRRHRHAGRQARERDEAPAVERQVDDLPVVDDVAEPRGFAAQQRRVGGDGDGFGQPADLELQVEPNGFARGEPDAVAGQRPESAQLDAHAIGAGREAGTTYRPFGPVTTVRDRLVPAAATVTVAQAGGRPPGPRRPPPGPLRQPARGGPARQFGFRSRPRQRLSNADLRASGHPKMS